MTDIRPVWLTHEQLEDITFGTPNALDALCDAWDAAPADSTEAVRKALVESTDLPADERRLAAANVLRALGMPDA